MILLYDGCYLKLKIYLLYFLILRSIYIPYVKKKRNSCEFYGGQDSRGTSCGVI